MNGHVEIVKIILAQMKKFGMLKIRELLDKKNNYGFTPLMITCFRGYHTSSDKNKMFVKDNRLAIVKMMIKQDADVNYKNE
jgi:hypothetical protein